MRPSVEEEAGDDTPSSTVIRRAEDALAEERDDALNLGGRIEQYELIRPLGRGGMGTVYLARDTRLGRLVAIKLVRNRRLTSAERFRVEARATARCVHENIVVIHDIGEQDGYLYMVLEYLAGQTLKQWLERRARSASSRGSPPGPDGTPGTAWAPLPVRKAVEIVVPVVRALVCAHGQGIVHRDLKPSNIMLTDTGVIKVLDFGVAKLLEVADDLRHDDWPVDRPIDLTVAGKLVGSALYMSPEQWAGSDVDDRSDLWAVGVILYELVTGVHPLRALPESALRDVAELAIPVPPISEFRPDLGRLGSIIDRCLIKRRADRIGSARELLAELEALSPDSARRGVDRDDDGPYTGLVPFQEDDADRFYGRSRDVATAVARLGEQPLLAIVGPSGAGKSSFVRAGLVPALKRSGEAWEALVVRPGRQPLLALGALLAEPALRTSDTGSDPTDEHGGPDRAALAERLRGQPGLLGTRLRARARRKLSRTLLFIDQFEELFTLGASDDERQAFAACLEAAADDVASPLRVVLSIRSDFLDRVTETRPLMNALARGVVLLPPIARAGLREILTRPLESVGYGFESESMIDDMLDALDRTGGALPLLQFTAAKLWEGRDRKRHLLTVASYQAIGGVAGTLATHADATLAAMSAPDQALARQIIERLVTPERTRAIASVPELRELARDPDAAERVLTRLVEARLLVVEAGAEREGATAELVHESLIEGWPTLSRWLSEHQDDAAFLARVRAAAREWRASNRPQGLLWRDEAMLEARRWRRRSGSVLGPAETEFLDAVFALARHTARRRRNGIVALVLALVAVAGAMTVLALRERRASSAARDQAERARTAAGDALREAGHARDGARLASARGREADPTLALALLREVEAPERLPAWPALASRVLRAPLAEAVLTGHEGVLWTVDVSPDGRHIATASADAAWLWPTDGAEPRVLRGHTGPVWQATFSPDGRRVITSSWDRTARLWSVDGKGPPVVLEHPDRLSWASWSPDGSRVVTASWDRNAWVWRSDGTGAPIVLRGHTQRVRRAFFSPDGAKVLTTSFDDTARLWSADGSGAPLVLAGHDDTVWTAAFSPDGGRVATASTDGTVRIWDLSGRRPPIVLRGHTGWVVSVAWSPDGQRVVSGSHDTTARVWSADGTGAPMVLAGHTGDLQYVAFTPDGTRVLTASSDATARLWNVDGSGTSTVFAGHERGLLWSTLSRDGRLLVTASGDRTARVWRVRQDGAPATITGPGPGSAEIAISPDRVHLALAWPSSTVVELRRLDGAGAPVLLRGAADRIRRIDVSPDGRRVLAASSDGAVRVWPIEGGSPVVLRGHTAPVVWASWSPDSATIATASSDRTARLWRADGTGAPIVLRGHTTGVNRALFSGDGARVVTTADDDSTARVWDARTGAELAVLRGHTNKVHWAELSPDGTRVATCSADNTARIWMVDDPIEPIVLDGHTHEVRTIHWSADGRSVVTAGDDGTARVWNALGGRPPVVLRGPESPFMSSARFSPDGVYVLTATDDDARVWRADGTGTPLVLDRHTGPLHDALFTPDATGVVTSAEDGTVLLWSQIQDIPSIEALQDRLWSSSEFCMPVDLRTDLLGISREIADDDLRRCRAQVQAHRTP